MLRQLNNYRTTPLKKNRNTNDPSFSCRTLQPPLPWSLDAHENQSSVNRSFHVKVRRNGSKSLEDGPAVVRPAGRIPRITRLLALAHRCRDLVRDGIIINQSELAHYGQISTTRMSQIMWLDNLAPDIQEKILGLPRTVCGRDAILEREVRPIAKTHGWGNQRTMWIDLLNRTEAVVPTDQI